MNAGFLFGTGGGLLVGCDQLLTLRVNEDRQIRAAYMVPTAVMASRILPHRPARTSRKA